MKYARLTKEQFEELHQEFINFLATQTITADEWRKLKEEKPEVAEHELDIFSDLIWEGVLNKVKYLEHISPKQMMLFHISEAFMELIAIKVEDENVDITTEYGYKWLQQNDRNKDVFVLIQQGSVITKGALYNYFSELLSE